MCMRGGVGNNDNIEILNFFNKFIISEIKGGLFYMGLLKVSGSDGVYVIFFWEMVKDDFVNFISRVFDTGVFSEEINKFLVYLILKIDNL